MRWALAWLLYWLGDMVSRWNDNDRRFTTAGFKISYWLFLASDTVQGDGPNGPWSAVASAIEAQRATTVQQGVVHESAVPEGQTPNTHSEAPDNG